MAVFNGQLNPNEIFASLFNMIISQQVFGDNIAGAKQDLVDMARVDGSMYGDTKLYYYTDVLRSYNWGNDAEAENLLRLYRPADPKQQKIVFDIFRQIPLTVDHYLTKRAWGTEGAFSQFNSVMLGWLRGTKKVYDITTYNTYIGTTVSPKATENITINLTQAVGEATGEEKARIEGGVIGEAVANLLVNLKDLSRDFNDEGVLSSYDANDLVFVWNASAVSGIEKRDLPTIYHKDIIDKFAEHTLPARYFGTINTSSATGNGTTIRSLIEQDVTKASSPNLHVFAGDLIPSGYTAPAKTSYTVNPKVLFKVYCKNPNSVPYMSAFEVGTSFFNPKSLTETHYLTFGHNTLSYLTGFPFITVTRD